MGADFDSVFIPIAYHTWYPIPDDPFYLYNPAEIRERIGYYENQQVPQFFLDGMLDCGNAPELWPPYLQDRIQVSSPLELSFTGYYRPDSQAGEFTVTVYAEDDPVSSNLWLRIAVIESDIHWQAPNGASIHNYIFRDMIPSADGQSVDIEPGETKYFTYSFDIPSPLVAENCMLVAFIQSDQDRQILQGAKIGILDLNSTTDLIRAAVVPDEFRLNQNYPNPFNSQTSIGFHTETGFVELTVFDITGSVVKRIFEGNLTGGYHNMVWDGKDRRGLPVSSGIYYYRLTNGSRTLVRKMTFLK